MVGTRKDKGYLVFVFTLTLFFSLLHFEIAESKARIVRFDKYVGQNVIYIDISERRLYYTRGDGKAYRYPIAVGKSEEFRRYGTTKIVHKKKYPEWRPTPRMRKEDPELPEVVEPGPKNPLGSRMLYLGWESLGIHGNNNPFAIGTAASSGCFRMFNADVESLYKKVKIGTKVVVAE